MLELRLLMSLPDTAIDSILCVPMQMVPRDWFRGGLLKDLAYYKPFST